MRIPRILTAAALAATLGPATLAVGIGAASAAETKLPADAPVQQIHGFVVAVQGNVLTLRLRDGQTEGVDIAAAKAGGHLGIMPKGGAIVVYGSRDPSGIFHVQSIGHTSSSPANWSPDS